MQNLVLSVLIFSAINATAIPGTDITIFKLLATKSATAQSADRLTLEPTTHTVQRKGYDNQPKFIDNHALLFTREIAGQTEIIRWSLGDSKQTQMTETPVSEYSPTPLAKGQFSVVVAAGEQQSLWIYQDGKALQRVNGPVEPVGYHAWLGNDVLAMFRLADPHELVVYSIAKDQMQVVAKNIGRTLISQNTDQLWFTLIEGDQAFIAQYNHTDGSVQRVTALPSKREDFAWHPKHGFIASDGQQLLRWQTGFEAWQPLVMSKRIALTDLTRIAISPDGTILALVHQDR